MPVMVDFELECSAADRARVRATEALFEGLAEGSEPTELPPELLGVFRDVAEFMDVFADNDVWSLGGHFYEVEDAIVFQDDDAELERLAALISYCCRDALPVAFSWKGDGCYSGSVAIFKDKEFWLNQEAAEQLLLEQGRREAAELATA